MADYSLTKDAAAIDATLNLIDESTPKLDDTFVASAGVAVNQTVINANNSGAGKIGQSSSTQIGYNSFFTSASLGGLTDVYGISCTFDGDVEGQIIFDSGSTPNVYARVGDSGVFSSQTRVLTELFTSPFVFRSGSVQPGDDEIVFRTDSSQSIELSGSGTTARNLMWFANSNGYVGRVQTSGSTTSFLTSSDPRYKDILEQPSDEDINDYFNRLYNSAIVYTWKNDPNKNIVWGFNAHLAIDNGLYMGAEGEGSRDLAIGDVYEGATYGEDGEVIEQEKIVSGASVDPAKDMAALVYKIEQLERRITTLENK